MMDPRVKPLLQTYSQDAARIASLRLIARQTVEGFSSGRHVSPHRGSSVEFKQHRPYVTGDELRNIDWKAYGKSDRLFLREFDEETNLRCMILLDTSGSMGYAGSRARQSPSIGELGGRKFDFGVAMAVAITYLLLSNQDSVGLITFDDRLRSIVPHRGQPSQLQVIATTLADQSPGGETDLGRVLKQVIGKLPKRSMVIVISDGFGDPASLANSLAMLRSNHQDVQFLQTLDPDEMDFPFRDRVRFRDLEDDRFLPDVDAAVLKRHYLDALSQHNRALVAACRRHRVDHTLASTDAPLIDTFIRFVRRGAPAV